MLKRNLGSVAMSLAEIVIGILLLVNPVGFTSGIIVTFGVVLMITGIGTNNTIWKSIKLPKPQK